MKLEQGSRTDGIHGERPKLAKGGQRRIEQRRQDRDRQRGRSRQDGQRDAARRARRAGAGVEVLEGNDQPPPSLMLRARRACGL